MNNHDTLNFAEYELKEKQAYSWFSVSTVKMC